MIDLFAAHPQPDLARLWERMREVAAGRADAAEFALLPEEFAAFAELYLPIAAPGRVPFVFGQLGQSLDGYIATKSGASHYVNGPECLVHLHRLRALADAVVVGRRTVSEDNPQLTVRRVTGGDPLRVVIDVKGCLAKDRRVFSPGTPGALRLTAPGTPPLKGVESIAIGAPGGRCDPGEVVKALAARGCRRILVEGGGAMVSSFLAAGALDRLHVAVAPLFIGEGRRGISLPGAGALSEALRPPCRKYAMGEDVLFDFDLRAPGAR